jgi:pimeloyl-ACP methyl ester carboxylesterase
MKTNLQKKKIIFVYGISGGITQFETLVEMIGSQAECVVVSHSGHDGKHRHGLGAMSYDAFANEVLAEAEHAKREGYLTVVCGHSQGGGVALIAAKMRPDLVDGVVAVSPSLIGDMTKAAVWALVKSFWFYLPPLLLLLPFRMRRKDLHSLFFNGAGDELSLVTLDRMCEQPGSSRAVWEAMRRKIGKPATRTLLVTAMRDKVLRREQQEEWAREHRVPCASVDCNHMSALRSSTFAQMLRRFVAELSPKKPAAAPR